MRFSIQRVWAWAIAAAALAPAWAAVQAPAQEPTPRATAPGVIGTHQIDRFEAIRQLQESVKARPDNEADWILLGELAHEAAQDLPSDQDDQYYKMSREAYERALRLDPSNAGLKAAVQFAKDQEANAKQFDEARKAAVPTYLEARRRELAQSRNNPTIQVYAPASPVGTVAPAGAATPTPSAPVAGQPAAFATTGPAYYGQPIYRPFVTNQGQPYSYQQYANSYAFPSNITGQPMTMRQYTQQLPGMLLNSAIQGATRPR